MQATQVFGNTQEMYNYAANQLIVQKLNAQTVKNNLMKMGVSLPEADTVVQNLLVQMQKDQPAQQTQQPLQTTQAPQSVPATGAAQDGKKTMLLGLAMIAIGIVITGVSYSVGEGTYVMTYGLIGVGAWYFIKGLVKMMAGK